MVWSRSDTQYAVDDDEESEFNERRLLDVLMEKRCNHNNHECDSGRECCSGYCKAVQKALDPFTGKYAFRKLCKPLPGK
jgi:hypothetical protein